MKDGDAVADEETRPKKLTAVMSIDIAGYSAMTEIDEADAAKAVVRLRAALDEIALKFSGRIFNTAGDGFMLEFASAAGALMAAEHLCNAVERASVRVGVHVGDVLVAANGDLLGHTVNVAARLQQIAQPGVVVVSHDVCRAVRGKLAQRLHAAGSVQLDKMGETLDIFTLEAMAALKARARRAEPVLAVLPFDNDSDDAGMEYFSDGVADEIILTLMRQSSLRVIGRTSAFQFRGEKKTDAAAVLKASHVLDGAVRRQGEKLRVNTQLIEARDGVVLWSARYDGEAAKAFELQDSIAAEVGAALKHAFTRSERGAQPIDAAAYDLYLRARYIWLSLCDADELQAETLLMRCLALAPDFAPAWAALASVRAFLLPRDHDIIGQPMHAAAVEAAETALEIDPDCAAAFAALSLLKPAFAEHEEKLRLVREALRRTPNDPSLHVARAAWLYSVGRLREASAAMEVSRRLDPLGPAVESLRASLLSARGAVDTALDIVSNAWVRWPDSAFTWYTMWETLVFAGRYDEAEALTQGDTPPRPAVEAKDIHALRAYVAILRRPERGRRAACDALLAELAAAPGALPISSCMIAAGSGCVERAFDLIDTALDRGRPLRPDPHDGFGTARAQAGLQFFVNNCGEPIWRHPRFARLSARLGLAQYWLSTRKWPDCAEQAPYDFKVACADAVEALSP